MIPWWILLIILPIFLIVGVLLGFFVTRYFIKQQIEKNPPVNEDMIRAIYSQMGRKPSEKQIKSVLLASKQSANNKKFTKSARN